MRAAPVASPEKYEPLETESTTSSYSSGSVSGQPFWRKLLAAFGPGLMVCLADTDGSCLLTAAASGSLWRYRLLLLQLLLIPVLYFAQELTVRLALAKGKGLSALLRQEVGPVAALLVAVPLLVCCFFALISEITLVAETLEVCWGTPLWLSATLLVLGLSLLALTGSYKLAERVGLAMGSLQVLFFVTMALSAPSSAEVLEDIVDMPLEDSRYLELVTANIGAVIMPWMLAYQQSALCERTATLAGEAESAAEELCLRRVDTVVGSLLTQGVMAAILLTVGASSKLAGKRTVSVAQLLECFRDLLGSDLAARVLLTFAFVGACLVAAIVVTLCGAWTLEGALGSDAGAARAGEVAGACPGGELSLQSRSEEGAVATFSQKLRARPIFYASFVVTCAVAWCLTVLATDFAVALTGVWTQFLNGILMPPIIFTIWYLSAYKLPEEYRLSPALKWSLFVLFGMCSATCALAIPAAVQDVLKR